MDPSMRIMQLQRLARDLMCWGVKEWSVVDGWSADGRPLRPNEVWARERRQYRLACPSFSVPEDWPLEDTYLEVSAYGYGMIKLASADGISSIRPFNEYNRVFALPGRRCSAEATIAPIRDRTVGFVALGDTWMARVIVCEPAVALFCRLLGVVCDTAKVTVDLQLRQELLRKAEEAVSFSSWPSSSASYVSRVSHDENLRRHWTDVPVSAHPPPLTSRQRASIEAAADMLAESLRKLKESYASDGAVKFYGYAHTDAEWLWPEHVSIPAIVGQFAGSIAQLERFPEFRFGQAGAYLYSILEQREPRLFAKLKEHVESGRWELLTGMWVEVDAIMTGGESLIRQLVHGQGYFRRRFGRRSRVCWLPDTFGFSGALPQLLAGSGMDYFFTTRLSHSPSAHQPGNLFNWEGIDGTKVLAHVGASVKGYQCLPSAGSVAEVWRDYLQGGLHPEVLQPIGYANGIGPTDEDVAAGLTLGGVPGIPAVSFTSAEGYFALADRQTRHKPVPIWRGELYLEQFRGTFTTQGRTKVLHRRAENSLVTAETVGALRALRTGMPAPALTESWHRLLKKQTHDIIGGTCIREVHEEAEREFREIGDQAQAMASQALTAMAEALPSDGEGRRLVFLNPTLSWRQVRAVVPGWQGRGQRVGGGTAVAAAQAVPPLSVVWAPGWAAPGVTVSGSALENECVRVEITDDGLVSSLFDKRVGRELLSGHANEIRAYFDRPFHWDAWELSPNYREFPLEELACTGVEIVESGPCRAAVRVTKKFRDSEICQEIRLWAGAARIDFATWIDWHERRVLLRAYFPTVIEADHATYECAHGVIRRPTRAASTWDAERFEVPAHRFVDLSGDDGGVTLLNNGRYGHCVESRVMSISLLRSPVFPDSFADEGSHHFTYSLYPHPGDWVTGGVLAEATDVNDPLPCVESGGSEPGMWQGVATDGLPLALGTFKAAEDSAGLVFRAYEPAGGRGPVSLRFPPGWAVTSELNLLEDRVGPPQFTFGPHQIRTWLVEAASQS
jgi:alpha-mannosidase